jgi:two-component system chemotaxis response regulator CheY
MVTVLVVDDSRIMRNIVKNTFSMLDIPCEYVEAADGQNALLQLGMKKIDLVLLDWNMPHLSGLDFLKTVRANGDYKNMPVIMVTSESARYSVIEAVKNGVTDYITKPVNERIFKEKISRLSLL